MSRHIMFLAKIFKQKSYAQDFIDGKLYANRLSFFKKMEDEKESNRKDRHEAATGWYQKNDISLLINDCEVTDISGPIMTQINRHDNLNVYCLYAGHSGEFSQITIENLDSFRKHLEIPEDCLILGDYAVVLTNASEFMKRVLSAIKIKKYGIRTGLVNYYDPDTFSGSFDDLDALFAKRDEYSHQKEYRISIDTGVDGDDAITLDIGDISDIAILVNTSNLNNLLEIKLPKGDLISC